jgi:hypothetical protein
MAEHFLMAERIAVVVDCRRQARRDERAGAVAALARESERREPNRKEPEQRESTPREPTRREPPRREPQRRDPERGE